MIKTITYLVINCNDVCWFMSNELQEELKKDPKPILWCRQGLHGVIPNEVIQNELRVRAERKRLAEVMDHLSGYWDLPLGFRWGETLDIVQALSSDETNEQRPYCGGSDPNQGHNDSPNVL